MPPAVCAFFFHCLPQPLTWVEARRLAEALVVILADETEMPEVSSLTLPGSPRIYVFSHVHTLHLKKQPPPC